MDRTVKYQNIIIAYLKCYAANKPANLTDTDTQILIDRENNHYQLTYVGWQSGRFIFSVIFHFDIKDSRVWVQCNNTGRLIDRELVQAGVAAGDVVLGFVPEGARERVVLF